MSPTVFLYLMPAAALPVVWHLFLRVRRRPVAVSTLMFFERMDPRLTARRRIREWLALLLRCACIALVLLALYNPTWRGAGGGGRVALVVALDNSASMSALAPDGREKRAVARAGAQALLADLAEDDLAGLVLLVDDPLAAESRTLTADKTAVRAALGGVGPTQARGSPSAALARAAALLSSTAAAHPEVHVFTDLQAGEWERAPARTPRLRPDARVYVHAVPSAPREGANVAMLGAAFARERVLAGRPALVRVRLANPEGPDTAVHLGQEDDSGARTTRRVALAAGAQTEVTLSVVPQAPGAHWVRVWVEGDAFAADNQAFVAFRAAGPAMVLFAGEVGDYGMLPLALAPRGAGSASGLRPVGVPAASLPQAIGREQPALVAVTWRALARAAAEGWEAPLRDWVEGGGRLLVVPDPEARPGAVQAPAWVGANVQAPVDAGEAGEPVLVFDAGAPLFDGLRDGQGRVPLANVRARRFHALEPGAETSVLFGLADGRALLAQTNLGAGQVLASGLAFGGKWSNFPFKPMFLPVAQRMALARTGRADEDASSLAAGDRLPAPASNAEATRVHALAGSPLDWTGPAHALPAFPRAGVYAMQAGERTRYVGVHSAPDEGAASYVSGTEAPALGGWPHEVERVDDARALARRVAGARRGTDLFVPLLLAALAVLAAEGFLVNPHARRARARTAPARAARTGALAGMGWVGWSGDLLWRPHLGALSSALAVLAVLAAGWMLWQRVRGRADRGRALLVLAPKALAAGLLVLALFGPRLRTVEREEARGRMLVAVDRSGSMAVRDAQGKTRLARAQALLGGLQDRLPRGMEVDTFAFDTALAPLDEAQPLAPAGDTDLGACLARLGEQAQGARPAQLVVFTDGGDEAVRVQAPAAGSVHVVGVGAEPRAWRDLAVHEVDVPPTAEKGVQFPVRADVVGRTGGDPGFARALDGVDVMLEEEVDGDWRERDRDTVSLAHGRARVTFAATPEAEGLHRYRVRMDARDGELTDLNNARPFTVDVRARALHVLYFTRELGLSFKMLRQELARDPSVTFTALVRTAGERFTVQGDRPEAPGSLAGGFPTDPEALAAYDCVVLGAFGAGDFPEACAHALVDYVADGGAVVFLGGEGAFGAGGWAASPVGPLLPWRVHDAEPPLARGQYPVQLPLSAAGHPVVAGLEARFAAMQSPVVESLNQPGPPRPAAATLLQAAGPRGPVALAAVQPFGSGRTLGLATNTFWRWARATEAHREAYGLFWRQAVRYLTGRSEAGEALAVEWDRAFYRPGEEARAEVRLIDPGGEGAARLAASLSRGEESRALAVEPVQGASRLYAVRMRFPERGAYRFRLTAYRAGRELGAYEKPLEVGPRVPEGARLEVDHDFLRALAESGGGGYAPEAEAQAFLAELVDKVAVREVEREQDLVRGGLGYIGLFVGLLAAEWTLRRRMNWF